MVISRAELRSLIDRIPRPGTRVLSAYLSVDQSQTGNLNHGYERALKDLLRSSEQRIADEKERKEFISAAGRILAYVSNCAIHGRTLVLFAEASNGLFWQRDVYVSIAPVLRWEENPYVRPLVEAVDGHERYGVVVVDREKGRLFTAYMGRIEEHRDVFPAEKRKNSKSTSRDSTLSQPSLHRHEDEHALWHLKDVAAELERLEAAHKFDRLLLAGPHEITTALHGILPKKLQGLVVRSIPLPIDAGEQVVLKETVRIEEEVERAGEVDLVERLITAAAKANHAVIEMQPTLDAARKGSLLKLVYVSGLSTGGAQCTRCGSFFLEAGASCAYCDGSLRPVLDIVASLADRVIDSGGQTDNVTGPAAARLRAAGGIGAILRY
jgi:hypothetical protein